MMELDMQGNDYYEYYRISEGIDLDVTWNHGEWILKQLNFYNGSDYDNKRISIRPGRETYVSYVGKICLDSLTVNIMVALY